MKIISNKCPLCDSNKYIAIEQYGIIGLSQYECRMVRCFSCNHYYSNTSKNINFEELYSEGKYKVIDTRGGLFDKLISIDDRLIIWQLSKLKVSKETLLDFGCGKGQFIHRALKYKWKVKGIETEKNRANFGINKYGLDITTREYKTGLVSGAPFNVITFFHVLEHLPQPKILLRKLIDNNLTHNGYLVIEVPFFESLQSKIAGKRWIHLDPPLHISHFTKSSLIKLFCDLNIKPIKYEYFSIHLGILGMVQSILSLTGYNKKIISELKFRRTKRLIISILLVLPLAIILELLAVIFNKGGVIRVYCKNMTKHNKMINTSLH